MERVGAVNRDLPSSYLEIPTPELQQLLVYSQSEFITEHDTASLTTSVALGVAGLSVALAIAYQELGPAVLGFWAAGSFARLGKYNTDRANYYHLQALNIHNELESRRK
jgi:hypothetical protein